MADVGELTLRPVHERLTNLAHQLCGHPDEAIAQEPTVQAVWTQLYLIADELKVKVN